MFPRPPMQYAPPPPYFAWDPATEVGQASVAGIYSNGNRTFASANGGLTAGVFGTVGKSSGKWYFEAHVDVGGGSTQVGIATTAAGANDAGRSPYGYTWEPSGAIVNNNYTTIATAASYTTGDVLGFAIDFGALHLWVAKNGVWQLSGNPATGANPTAYLSSGTYFADVSVTSGQVTLVSPPKYAPPSGFSYW